MKTHSFCTDRDRGQMQACYHSYCDGLDFLGDKNNLLMLAVITDTMIRTLAIASESKCMWNFFLNFFELAIRNGNYFSGLDVFENCPDDKLQKCFTCSVAVTKLFHVSCEKMNKITDEFSKKNLRAIDLMEF